MTDESDPTVVREHLVVERAALAATLRSVGPEAPTLVPDWAAADLAAHLAATEKHRGLPTFLGRQLVTRFGLRLNDTFRGAMDLDRRRFTRRGFDWAVARIERDGPALLARPSVLPVSVFEVFVHHEDVRRPNDVDRTVEMPHLVPTIRWLLRYHRRLLGPRALRAVLADGKTISSGGTDPGITIRGEASELVMWLAGRRAHAAVAVEMESGADAHLVDRLRV